MDPDYSHHPRSQHLVHGIKARTNHKHRQEEFQRSGQSQVDVHCEQAQHCSAGSGNLGSQESIPSGFKPQVNQSKNDPRLEKS